MEYTDANTPAPYKLKKQHSYIGLLKIIAAALFLLGLYFTTRVNYLLFHALVEIFSIVVAFCVFVIAWHSKKYIQNNYLLFIGVAYFFIAILDLLHTLSYKGMSIFTDYDYYANQLWIGARFIESLTLVLGFAYLSHGRQISAIKVFVAYSVVTLMLILSIFAWKVFPECFIKGFGLTPFKKISEYIICTILLAAVFLLRKNRLKFDSQIYRLLFFSILCTMVSELAFTFYVSNYGFSNLVGHYFKLFSFCLIYLAIIRTGMEEPFALIFREIESANQKLKAEISMRIQSEHKREQLIVELKNALEEIKTLKGIIPICANCKKIRDDTGYWNQLEDYISTHSDAKFSHGICPDCMEKLYPDMNLETS